MLRKRKVRKQKNDNLKRDMNNVVVTSLKILVKVQRDLSKHSMTKKHIVLIHSLCERQYIP